MYAPFSNDARHGLLATRAGAESLECHTYKISVLLNLLNGLVTCATDVSEALPATEALPSAIWLLVVPWAGDRLRLATRRTLRTARLRACGIARMAAIASSRGMAGMRQRRPSLRSSIFAFAWLLCSQQIFTSFLAPLGHRTSSTAESRSTASRRHLLSLAPSLVTTLPVMPTDAEEAPQLTASWPAKDGVQFLRFYEEQYNAERDDTRRTPQFIKAIQERIRGREGLTVLDIGTGPFALFATVAARAGAKKVYAVEGNPEAADRARTFLQEQEDIPEGVIEVHGCAWAAMGFTGVLHTLSEQQVARFWSVCRML